MVQHKTKKKTKDKSKSITYKNKSSTNQLVNNRNTFKPFEKDYNQTNNHIVKSNLGKELVKLFKTPFTPSKYNAKDDFYTYINYEWLSKKDKEMKHNLKYYVQIDSFRVTQEKVYYELIDIVKNYIKENNTAKSQAIKNVYESLYYLDNTYAKNFVNYYVNIIDERIASDNIYNILGNQNRNEIISWGCPLVWSVLKDEKNVSVYKSYISAPKLTAYDYFIYIEDAKDNESTKKYKKQFKRKFLDFLEQMFELCLGKGHGIKCMDVWDCEYELLNALGSRQVKNDDPDGYNVMTQKEALDICNFDWNQMATIIGYKKVPKTFICSSKNYVKAVMTLLTKDDAWKTPKWRTYYLYTCFRQVMLFNIKWRPLHFEFFKHYIKGQPLPYPREIFPVFGLSFCFNSFLTNKYIDQNKKQEYIDYTHNMATDLLTIYKRIIKRNNWLSPSTKKYALLKLEKIKLVTGSPKILREDPLLTYSSRDAYGNMRKLAHWRCKEFIRLDGESSETDIPLIDWEGLKLIGKQSYIVNAFYTPTENSIYIPLAYLQKPFIDLSERGIEYNLAHIGYTLAHEMSHSLDDLGSRYDEKGNLHNWWTKHDRKIFDSKVKDVVKQYEQFAAYDGIKFDASISTGEDLADISGLAICREYLKDFQDYNNDILPIRSLSFNAFFIYIAVQARQKVFENAIKAQLKTNPHPMEKYRTNCPLARSLLFRSMYNVKEKDKMYWHSTDNIW